MGKSDILLFSVLIVFSVLWKPAYTDDKCSVGCKGTPSGATFLNGHKYNYAVEGEVSIYLTGADKQETSVKLLGQVSVSALGNCAHVLKVQNLAISGPDGKKYGKPPGLEKPVRFTLQDGHVGAEICAEEGDTRRSLNIKRAVISLLQSGVKSGTEIDVFGACPTDASSSQEGAAVLVHRSRDLSNCGHREHGKNDLITAVYNPHAEIKNTQILKSQLNIESKVNSGVPEKVSAIEEHLYKPFSVGENGARAKVHTKLTLTGKDAGGDNGKFTVVKPIIFENPHGGKLEASNLESAAAAVKETAATLATEASSKSAGHFAQLVRVFRYTNKDDLLKLYAQVKGKNLERRVFLDGLLRAGTGASIEASVQLLKTKELSPLEQKLVFLSLGNARHVNDEAIKAAASLLDIPNIPKEVYLGVGALASAYCRAHNCHAGHSEGIKELSNKLGSKLNCKAKEKVKEDYVIAVLKGIRNIRHLEDSIIEKVVHCATDNAVKARVRVAALEAFRADPCSAKVKKAALDLLKNRQQDSEIRIKAYLALIECPCGKSANEIKTLLETEPVHQVGRFITSSLRHIRASTNPDKRSQRQHYGLISTPNKFHVDDRKYSFYREASYSVDALGIGGSVEETVIYSQDSFLPRSVSLNLTAEVFGHSLNVLEIGGRQGNLDRVVEHFLGPKSFLRTENHQKLYDELVKRVMATQEKVEKKLTRGRRSVKTDIDNFDKHVKAESAPFDNELDMDIYVKLFGTDAVFLSLGDDKGINFDQVLDEILKYIDTGINQAKHFQQEIRSHLLFLDAELAYATSTGLPLKLNLVGSATARLEVSTACDIRQIFRDFGKNAKVDVKFVPSTNIEISGLFYVDGDAVATGLKVVNNLHSSTGAHVVAKLIENGQGFDLQLGLPVDKQEIVTASHDLVYFTREKGQEEKHVALKVDVDRKEYSGCFDQLSGILGLTLCGEVSVPFSVSGPEAQASLQKFLSRYPLTGSTKLKLLLEKNDLKGYHIKGLFRGDNAKRSFELLFDAQGSKNRKTAVSGELVNSAEERSLSLNLESPIKNAQGRVALITSKSEYAAIVKAKLDAEEYYGKVGFNVQGNEQRSVFKPVLEYQLPGPDGKKTLKVDGQIVKSISGQTQKYTLEGIKISLPKDEVVDVQGGINFEPVGFDADLKAKKGDQNLLLAVVAKNNEGKIEFQNTLNPVVNFKLVAHIDNSKGNHRNDLDLYYSGDLKNPNNRVSFNQLLKYHQNPENSQDFGLITKNKLHVYALPLLAKVDAEADPKKLNLEVEGKYVDQKADLVLDARTHLKQAGDYQVNFHANVNDKGVEGTAKRVILSADKSNFENHFSVKNVASYDLSGVVLHKLKPNDVNVGAIGQLKLSSGGKNEEIKFDVGAVENAKLYSAHGKISRGPVAYIDALIKLNRGANPNGLLKFVLKDAVVANGNFKVNDADGKGNGAIIVDFKNAGRKIKGDVNFVAKSPVFNADADLFLNFEKDNADKIVLHTNNKRTADLIESKNKLSYGGKNFEVNVHSNYNPHKVNQNLEVVLPDERCLTLKFDVVGGEDKDNNIDRSVELLLSDAVKRGAAASILSYKGKLANTNYDKNTVNYDGQVLLKLKDGKTLENVFSLKNNPAGDKFKGEFKIEVKGNLLPHPATLLATAEYSDPDASIFTNAETYRVKGGYGSDYHFELTGKDEYDLVKTGEKKYQEENTLTVHLPFENAHDIKLVSNVLYILPENQDVFFEYSVTESVQVNADVYKIDASGKFGPKVGNSKVKVAVPHVDPFSLDASYKAALEGDKKSGSVDVKATYGKGKSTSVNVAATAAPHENSLTVKANSPQNENLKKLEVTVHTKKPSTDGYSSSVIVDADGRVYKSDLNLVYSKAHPLIDLTYSSPSQPKPSRVFVKGNAVSSTQGKIDVKIENIKDFSLDANYESQVQQNDIYWKLHANSDKLNMKNYKVDISSKDAANGKRLEFNAVNDGKNVFSGSTSYISKQEGPKTIIEGSGSVKVKEEQKSATFKYIRTLLTEGSEQGVETFMNVAIGERSYVAESRITNLEYKTSYVLCEEKKQCAHAELHSKLNVQKPGELEHTLNVALDLRKLGFSPELGLQASASISERRLPQYTMDLHVSKEDHKYHMHVYSTPEHGKFPAGITINLPKRVLALESLIQYPTNKNLPFPIKGEATLYMDKNKPQQKAAIRALVDLSGDDKAHNAVAEIGFSHPKMAKEAVLKFRGSLKRPTDNSLKIESAATLSCPVLGGDREAKVLVEASPTYIKIYVDNPIVKVIDLEGSVSNADQTQQANLKFSLLQGKPVQVKALVKEFKYFEFTTGYSEDADRKLSVTAHIDPEKRVDISADIILPNEKKNIAHGALFLQDNLVKSDYGVSKPNFNYFVNALKSDMTTLKQRVEQLADKTGSELKNTLTKIEPSLKDLNTYYTTELKKLVSDVSDDKVLKEISEAIHIITKYVAQIVEEILSVTTPIVDQVLKVYGETSKKLLELYNSKIEPQLKQLYGSISQILHEGTDGLIDLVAHFAAIAQDFFEKHKPELQELTNTLTEIFKDLTRLIVAQLKEFRANFDQILKDLIQQIKDMPVVAMIQEKIKDLAVPDQVLAMFSEAHQAVRVVLPTEETKVLSDAIAAYIQKKLRQQKVNDSEELRVIYEKATLALTSLIQFVRQQLNHLGVPSVLGFNALPFLSGGSQPSLPVFGPPAFSLLNMIIHGDFVSPLQLVRDYRIRSLNPLDEVPAKLRAVVVNGQHIFTFDGRHLTFPGTCRYVLVHDHVDRNFTLAIQLQAGAIKGLLLEDKSGATVELKANGQVLVNEAAHGFPVTEKDLFAFREPSGNIGLGSRYGLLLRGTPDLSAFYVEVSGFYLGKLRGLLGDGNNEAYDDFRLPNGKIVTSESEFGHAYRLSSSCAPVKGPDHSHHELHSALPPACEQVFGGSSPLRAASLLLDITPFRQACIHAVASNPTKALQEACALGTGYTALAVTGLLPAVLPPACLQCTDADSPRNIGDSYPLKVPSKQADVVVIVETVKGNDKTYKELVVPLVGKIVDSLKAKHFDDIKVHLVGITSKMPYPLLYDTDNKLKDAKIVFDDETRNAKPCPLINTGNEKVDSLKDKLVEIAAAVQNSLGLTNVEAAYSTLSELPLRAGAVKHLLNVVDEACADQLPGLDTVAVLRNRAIYKATGATVSTVSGVPVQIGEGKKPGDIVGFSKDSVLLVGDKTNGKNTQALRATIHGTPYDLRKDYCIKVATELDGVVFPSASYFANAGAQKQYIQQAAANIVERMTQTKINLECVCAYRNPFQAKSLCVADNITVSRK